MLRAIAVVGLVAVLLIGAWGIIQIAFYIPTFFNSSTVDQANLGTIIPGSNQATGPESVLLTAPNIITSAQPFLLSWSHQNASGNYAYQLSYSCAAGVSLQALVPTGAYKAVACNTPFNFVGATSSTPIILTVSGLKQNETTLTISAQRLSDGAISASASSTTTVLPATNAAARTVVPTNSKPAVAHTPVRVAANHTNLSGLADFETSILSVTPTSANTNTALGPVHYTARFVVENIGTNVTPANWAFSASIPLTPAYTYNSPVQRALYPGDKIVYTLGFDLPQDTRQYFAQHTGTFSVTADPQNIANESNEANNTASVSVQL